MLFQVEYQVENGTIPSVLPCVLLQKGGRKSGMHFFVNIQSKKGCLAEHPLKIQIQKALLFAFAFAVHPALVVVLAAVFLRCHACGLLEYLDEVGLGGEAQVVCDGQGGLVQVS